MGSVARDADGYRTTTNRGGRRLRDWVAVFWKRRRRETETESRAGWLGGSRDGQTLALVPRRERSCEVRPTRATYRSKTI